MFIEEGMLIKATHDDGKTFTGTVYKIVVQPCKDDNNRPHALIFISQDKRFIEQEGEFGCVSEWVEKLKSIEVLEKSKDTSMRDDDKINFDDMIVDFIQGFDCDDYASPDCKKSLIITNQGIDGYSYWFGICCANGEPAKKTRGIGGCSSPLFPGGQDFIFSIPELLYRMDRLRRNHIQVIVDEAWLLNRTNSLGTNKQTTKEYPQTPTSEFFDAVINGTDYPNEKKVLYISKFDDEGNWTAFSCAYEGEDNNIVYGGHIGLCSASGESYLTAYNLLYWLERFRENGIEVIVDADWYLKLQRSEIGE